MEKIKSTVLTALILTYNEEENIGRVLDKLQWIERVIIVDSFSTDKTLDILKQYINVEVYQRRFDTHATQWNYGLSLVKSAWVLTLDADYILPSAFTEELKNIVENGNKAAYFSSFKFLVFGKALRGDNTTPRPVLFNPQQCEYFDDGHTQRLKITGETAFFNAYILHDDRKPLSRWLKNQDSYSIKECRKLLDPADQDRSSLLIKIRKTKVLAPFFVFVYCLFVKGLILNGWAGWYYTLQRTMVEMLFALRLIEEEKFK